MSNYYKVKGTPNMKVLVDKSKLNQEITIEDVNQLLMKSLWKDGKEELVRKYQGVISLIIEDLQRNENNNTIILRGVGSFSITLLIGNKILKLGYPRVTYHIPFAKEILQPVARKEFENFITIEVAENVDTNWYKSLTQDEIEEKMYQIYKSMRKQGAFWLDVRPENMGVLLKDNKIYWKPYFSKFDNKYHELEVDNEILGISPTVQKEILPAGSYVVLDTDLIFPKSKMEEFDAIYEKDPNDPEYPEIRTKQYAIYRKFEKRCRDEEIKGKKVSQNHNGNDSR